MVNRVDLLIYCDWLTDKNVDSSGLRVIVDCIGCGIIGMNRLGIDIGTDEYGFGFGDFDGNGDGYSNSTGFGDGYVNGDGSSGDYLLIYEGEYGCGFDLESDE